MKPRLVTVLSLAALAVYLPAARAALVSHWAFDGDLRDRGPARRDGSFTGGAAPRYFVGYDGTRDGSVLLDGDDDAIQLPGRSSIYAAGRYSVAFWVRAAEQVDAGVFAETDGSRGLFLLSTDPRGRSPGLHVTILAASGATVLDAASEGAVFDGAWHHVVWSDDGGDARLWIDGAADTANFAYTRREIGLDAAIIGAAVASVLRAEPCCFLGGAIDDLRLFDHALSESEVRELFGNACTPATITRVLPRLVSSLGGTRVIVEGLRISSGHVAFAGGLGLEDQVYSVSRREIIGDVPALPPGFHAVELHCDGQLAARLDDAVEAALPPTLESVAPDRVPIFGGTAMEVRGANLRQETLIRFGSATLIDAVVSADGRRITSKAPASTQSGVVDVSARDSRGVAVLPGAVTYFEVNPCDPASVRLDSVAPALITTQGGTPLEIRGAGFQQTHLITIGGNSLGSQQVVFQDLIRGVAPALAPGFHRLELRCSLDGAPVAVRENAIEAAPPPELKGVQPSQASVDGGTVVSVLGLHFRPATVVRIDGRALQDAVLLPGGADVMTIRGVVPAGPGPGPVDVAVEDTRGRSVIPGLLTYVVEDLPPGPEQGEATIAEGTARFSWRNPIAYRAIQVRGQGGVVLAELPGHATFHEMATGGEDGVDVTMVGVALDGAPSRGYSFRALRQGCDTPPPLDAILQELEGRFEGLEYEDVEFSLYGAHSTPPAFVRCHDGGGAGGGGARGGGGAAEGPPRLGALEPGRGYIRRPSLSLITESETTTGFTLERPARKLEFAAHYRSIAVAAGVRLQAHLVHVYPDDGFEDVFTFPLTDVSTENDWHLVTYFRADSDVGRDIEGPGDEGPLPCPSSAECGGLEIPAGDYRLTLFAVGGNPEVAYYAVTADPSPEVLLVAGTPCPPYPLLRVRDVSDEDSLPVINGIDCTKLPLGICPLGDMRVRLTARGYWLDACNDQHPLDPGDPNFVFTWRIYDGATSRVLESNHLAWIELCLDCGCYRVAITVRKTGCPVSRTYLREVVVTPPQVPCNPGRRFEFLYPQPDPTGTIGIVGLNDPGEPLGTGYADKHPLEYTVLVSPNTECGGPGDGEVTVDDIEFELGNTGILGRTLGARFDVFDDCPFTPDGRKYFRIRLEDLGSVPAHDTLGSFNAQSVFLLGRARGSGEPWRSFGGPLKLRNPPDVLATSAWQGTCSPPGRYVFRVQSSEENEQDFSMGPSSGINLDISLLGDGSQAIDIAGHPDNGVQGGFTSQFSLDAGGWSDEEGTGGMRGGMMGNEISGAPLQVGPGGGGGGGSVGTGGGGALPEWEWCAGGNIFNYEFQEDIYKGIIYQGTIWVIPVSIWATIGFGFFLNIDYQLTFKLHPFSVVQGFDAVCDANDRPAGALSFADAWMYLLVDSGISLPAAIRCDILFGVASIALKLEPQAAFRMTPWLEAHAQLPDPVFAPHMEMGARFKLYASAEACIFWELACIRIPDPPEAIIDQEIFSCPDEIFDCICPGDTGGGHACIETCDESIERDCSEGDGGGGAAAGVSKEGAGGGGAGQGIFHNYALVSIPETIFSPDGQTVIDVWMSADEVDTGTLNVRQRGARDLDLIFGLSGANPFFLDPSGAYISGDVALIAFTETNAFLVEDVPALDIDDPLPYLGPSNRNAARANVRVHLIGPGTTDIPSFMGSGVEMSESSTDIADWRADGKVSMAGSAASGDAWIAWVRYEEEFLADHGIKQIRASSQPHSVLTVRDLRPQIDTTAIYLRQITYTAQDGVTAVNGMAPLKLSGPGINIEPKLAATRDGDVFSCIWVYDGMHENLTEDSRGRQLLFSLWDRAGGAWSAPIPVVRSEILDRYPAILEPRIALKRSDQGGLEGLLAFTSVPADSPPDDTGLGGLRFLHTVRFREEAGGAIAFDDPVLVHGRCNARVYVWDYEIGYDLGTFAPDPLDDLLVQHGPEAVIIFQRRGVPGTRASAGDVMATALSPGMDAWTPPMVLTGGERTITNTVAAVGASGIHALYLDQGAARPRAFGQGGGGGVGPLGYQTVDSPVRADLALASCKLSHQFAGPGARVRARVRVENTGLAGSAATRAGQSLTGVEIVYRAADGAGRVVASSALPVLQPGMGHELEFTLEMPHEPVRLEARVAPNPFDLQPANDVSACDFGAPCPVSPRCRAVAPEEAEEGSTAIIEWDNPVRYDEVFIYRDGLLLTSLPGASERYADAGVASGEHLYEVRGRAGASRSARSGCTLDANPLGSFRRGDANDDGAVNISDPVFTLSFLFLGGRTPGCLKAADVDDSGDLNITDAVFELGFLFLGGPPPRPPGHERCGEDPTQDALACEAQPQCAE